MERHLVCPLPSLREDMEDDPLSKVYTKDVPPGPMSRVLDTDREAPNEKENESID